MWPKWFRLPWEERTNYVPSQRIIPAPPWLTENQKTLWSSLVTTDSRYLSNPNILLLAVFVTATDTHRKAMLKVQELGELITDADGTLIVSPWITIANSNARIMIRTAKALGFTPIG